MVGIVLEAENLIVYRGKSVVLNDVSFEVKAGEVYALLGGNGAGKSTTLLTFLGLIKPVSGRAKVNGFCAQSHAEDARKNMAYVPETAALYLHLSARENLQYLLGVGGIQRSDEEIDLALDTVNLGAVARDRRLETYSKGMRQKAAIALALLRNSPALLMDEPTSGLDPVAVDEFHKLIDSLAKAGMAILMVTHDIYGACQVASRISLLREGKIAGSFSAGNDASIDVNAVVALFSEGVRG